MVEDGWEVSALQPYCHWWLYWTGLPLAPCVTPSMMRGSFHAWPWWWTDVHPGAVQTSPIVGVVDKVGGGRIGTSRAGLGEWVASPLPGAQLAPPVGPLGPLGTRRAAQAGPGVPESFVSGPGVPGAPVGRAGPGARGGSISDR